MLRVILTALAVLFALRLFARLTAPRPRPRPIPEREQRPRAAALTAAERERLEAERERALREGRQIDAIKIHRQLTGIDQGDAQGEAETLGRRVG